MKVKKVICIILVCLMCFISFPLFTSFNKVSSASGCWDDHTSAIGKQVNGYYEISTPAQLAYFNKNLNSYVSAKIKLTANMDMSSYYWKPNQSYKFAGLFEGQNYTISGIIIDGATISGNLGLFGKIDYAGQVKDLILRNCEITNYVGASSLYYGAGILCGYLEGASGKEYNVNNVKIYDSKIKVTENSSKNNIVMVGGVAGFSFTSIVKNCIVNNFEITNVSNKYPFKIYAGGIIGMAGNCTISVCALNGYNDSKSYSINVESCKDECYVGGIVGELAQIKNSTITTKIEKCYAFTNSMKAKSQEKGKKVYAGGIVGKLSYGSVVNCYNKTYVYSSAEAIITEENEITLNKITWNDGWYKEIPGTEGGTYWVCPGTRVDSKAKGSYNQSPDKSTSYRSTTYNYAGGIVGYTNANTTINYCYSTPDIRNNYNSDDYYQYYYYFKVLQRNWRNVHYYNWPSSQIFVTAKGRDFRGQIVGYNNNGAITNCYSANSIADYKSALNLQAGTIGIITQQDYTRKTGIYDVDYLYFSSIVTGTKLTITIETNRVSSNKLSSWTEGKAITIDNLTNDIDRSSGTTRFTYETTITNLTPSFGTSSTKINDIVTANSSVWATDSSINNGQPFIRDFYWKYSYSTPS